MFVLSMLLLVAPSVAEAGTAGTTFECSPEETSLLQLDLQLHHTLEYAARGTLGNTTGNDEDVTNQSFGKMIPKVLHQSWKNGRGIPGAIATEVAAASLTETKSDETKSHEAKIDGTKANEIADNETKDSLLQVSQPKLGSTIDHDFTQDYNNTLEDLTFTTAYIIPRCKPYSDSKVLNFFPPGSTFPPRGPHKNQQRREMEHVEASELTPERFFQSYVYPNKAVVIAGAARHIFEDADTLWTPEEVQRAKYAEIKMPVTQDQASYLATGDPYAWMNVKEIYEEPTRTVHFEKFKFSQYARPISQHLKLQKVYLAKRKNEITLLNATEMDQGINTFNLHLSNQGGALPHSHSQTLNFCFHGAKRWIMVDPMEYPNATTRHIFEKMDMWGEALQGHTSPLSSQEWFGDEGIRLLDSFKIPYYDFILEAGDAVFIPDMWTHATMDVCRDTVGVELKGPQVTSYYKPCWTVGLGSTHTPKGFKFGRISDPESRCPRPIYDYVGLGGEDSTPLVGPDGIS